MYLGQEQDPYLSDSSNHGKSRTNGAETSRLPQPNWTRNRAPEKGRAESGTSRSPSLSSTAEEKPPTGRKAEEPKLVTVRSVAPVAGVAVISEAPVLQYPVKKMDSTDQLWWLQDSGHRDNNNGEPILCADTGRDLDPNTNNTMKIPSYSIRKMDSSDSNRWLQEAEQANSSERSSSRAGSTSCSESTKSKGDSYGIRKMDSSDRNRWLQEATQEDTTRSGVSPTYDIQRTRSTNFNQCLKNSEEQKLDVQNSVSVDNNSKSDSHNSNYSSAENQMYSVRKMDSFDAPWWLKDENSPCVSDDSKFSPSNKIELKSDNSLTKSPEMFVSYGVRRMDSFDSPWWLSGDESKPVNSLNNNLIENRFIEKIPNESSYPVDPKDERNVRENQWWLQNGYKSRLETDLVELNGNSSSGEDDENYLDSKKLEPWTNDYPSVRKMDSSESNWWEEDHKNTDTRSTSVSIDWSRDGPAEPSNRPKNTPTHSPSKRIPGVRKMDSFDSPSWLASEESETQSHEPKQTSSGDAISSGSKRGEGDVANSSTTDWWGETNQSDDFVRTKRTSLRIRKIENVADEVAAKTPENKTPQKELNLQDELDQLMLFIGGCRNIDEILGNEEPPPAAPKTPPDTDSGKCALKLRIADDSRLY